MKNASWSLRAVTCEMPRWSRTTRTGCYSPASACGRSALFGGAGERTRARTEDEADEGAGDKSESKLHGHFS